MTKELILLAVTVALIVGFLVLLVRNWDHKGRRLVLIGDILLVSVFPASLIVPSDDLLLTIGTMLGLLATGFVLRIRGEKIGEDAGSSMS